MSTVKLSRSQIDLFMQCRRCFWLLKLKKIARPPGLPFSLNSAVDRLLKNEFDQYRDLSAPHPLMELNHIKAVPYRNLHLETWRNNFKGIRYIHEATGFEVYGAIDDIWQAMDGTLHIVDYKSTSKNAEIGIHADWQAGYRRQMEVYQWLFRMNDFTVSDKGYFVYCNALKNRPSFDNHLEFETKILSYDGNTQWIEPTLKEIALCLESKEMPASNEDCEYCKYFEKRLHVE